MIGYFLLVLCVCIINVPVIIPNIGPYGPMFLRNYKDYICPKKPNIGPFRPMFGIITGTLIIHTHNTNWKYPINNQYSDYFALSL